jgi:hypothetical protein
MKIIITERQLKKVLKKTLEKEIEEQEPASDATTTASVNKTGVSDNQHINTTGNPTKHEDLHKITRGPGNQLKVSPIWSETVGTTLTRGVDNQLK